MRKVELISGPCGVLFMKRGLDTMDLEVIQYSGGSISHFEAKSRK